MILRVKKRGDRGRLDAVAPPASFSVQEVPADPERVATPLRVRGIGGGGDGLRGVWLVGGGGRGGGGVGRDWRYKI